MRLLIVHWLSEYTTELLNVLHVLGRLVGLEEDQLKLLKAVCDGPLLTRSNLEAAGAHAVPAHRRKSLDGESHGLFADPGDGEE